MDASGGRLDVARKVIQETERQTRAMAKAQADSVRAYQDSVREQERQSAALNGAVVAFGSYLSIARQAAGAVGSFVAAVADGTARAEEHQRALTGSRTAYAGVSAATRGTVSAEAAVTAARTAALAQIHLSGEELAVVTRAAREYARANGTDLASATEHVTEVLVRHNERGLRTLGVNLAHVTHTAADTTEAIRQLGDRQAQSAPQAVTAAEAQEQFARATGEAKDQVLAFLGQGIGLTEFFAGAAETLRGLTDGTLHFRDALAGVAREVAGVGSARAQAQGGFFAQAQYALSGGDRTAGLLDALTASLGLRNRQAEAAAGIDPAAGRASTADVRAREQGELAMRQDTAANLATAQGIREGIARKAAQAEEEARTHLGHDPHAAAAARAAAQELLKTFNASFAEGLRAGTLEGGGRARPRRAHPRAPPPALGGCARRPTASTANGNRNSTATRPGARRWSSAYQESVDAGLRAVDPHARRGSTRSRARARAARPRATAGARSRSPRTSAARTTRTPRARPASTPSTKPSRPPTARRSSSAPPRKRARPPTTPSRR